MRFRRLRGGRRRALEDEAWVVLLGTTSDVDSLTVAAVTGTPEEAEALLETGARTFPERCNELNSCRFVTEPSGRPRTHAATLGILPGERRTVFVVHTTEGWVEVFERREDAEHGRMEAVAGSDHDARIVEAVTNTWVGPVGSDPRLRDD